MVDEDRRIVVLVVAGGVDVVVTASVVVVVASVGTGTSAGRLVPPYADTAMTAPNAMAHTTTTR